MQDCRVCILLPMTYLIADIGATHARFSLIDNTSVGATAADRALVLPTSDYQSAEALIRDVLGTVFGPGDQLERANIAGACFAVAGPVSEGMAQITNGGLEFSEKELEGVLACPLRLVNDFHALGKALPHLEQLVCLGGDASLGETRAVKALLGPGSGLGMSILVPELVPELTEGWQVLASEGGHADLAPGNLLEQEVLSLLLAEFGSVSWETVLSGPGLERLYRAVAALWGMTPRDLSAEQISRFGVTVEDPVCHQALEMFFGLLGAVAGNLALTVCARGGVYIGGGIVPKLRDFAQTSPLRRRFEERAGLVDYVADIPLYLIMDEDPGLVGARVCLTESR